MADAPPPSRRPRWYQDLRWIMAGLMLVVVSTTLYGLFRPDAPIVVSPATTVITEPLAADGLPDYAAHVLARAGRGTPPDDNAAVPLLMALWPLKLDEADLPAVCKELGIDVPSPPPDAFQADALSRDTGIRAAIEGILADRVPAEATSITPFDVIDAAGNHPWRAADLPALDAWLEQHAGRLDLLVTASRKSRLFWPDPNMLRGERDCVLGYSMALLPPFRQASRGLELRAMWHLGHGRLTEAWRDLLAMNHLARLAAAAGDGSCVSRLHAATCANIACAATLRLLDAPGLPAEVAALISQDLEALPPFPPHAQMIALDRLGFADFVIQAYTAPRAERRKHFEQVVEVMDDVFAATSLDGNVILADITAALLVPRYLDRPPTDPFSGGPFVYERRGAGYLLYSIGQNGRDDGGTDYSTPIVAGEWAEESLHLGDAKTTDVVVRLPLSGSPILERLRARP